MYKYFVSNICHFIVKYLMFLNFLLEELQFSIIFIQIIENRQQVLTHIHKFACSSIYETSIIYQ